MRQGLTLEVDRVEEFKEAFNAVAKELLTEELLTPVITIDAEIDLGELTPKYTRLLKQFAPFGPKNMRPTFVTRHVEALGQARIVGKNHLAVQNQKEQRDVGLHRLQPWIPVGSIQQRQQILRHRVRR